jgi:hypothetical protein
MRILIFAFALLLGAGHAFAAESELDFRQRIMDNAADLFSNRQFAKLNALEREYRGGERTPSGAWKLTVFYNGGLYFVPPQDEDFEKNWSAIFAIAKEWVAKNPSPAAYIVLANAYMNYGWDLSEAAQDDKKLFHEQTLLARKLLEGHKAEMAGDPHWYATMARIGAAQQWSANEVWDLYAKGVKASPYYYEMYYQVLDALVPYWDDPGVAAFQLAGIALQDTRGKDRELYARILWHAMQEKYAPYGWPTNYNWPQMRTSMNDLVARYPDQWNINNMAHIACRSMDKKLTASLMGRMTTRFDGLWDDEVISYDLCRKWTDGSAPSQFLAVAQMIRQRSELEKGERGSATHLKAGDSHP